MDDAAFRKACFEGDLAAVQAGLDAGCDPSEASAKGMTPLMLAVWHADPDDVVAALLDAGADPAARQPSSDWTATTFAAVNGRTRSLALLLERGGSVADDWKALHFAVQYRSADTIPMVLDAGVHVNCRDEEGRTALMRAARSSNAAFVTLLLERGADASAADAEGWTALHFAATKANVSNVRALVAAGADPAAPAADGRTPRDLATEHGRPKIVAALG